MSQLQALLSTIPNLTADDRALKEIRDLFAMYDADGSGELDRDEFIDLLQTAGGSVGGEVWNSTRKWCGRVWAGGALP